MRRFRVMVAAMSVVVIWGCAKSYDIRLNKTLDDMKYRKRLDDNLQTAAKGKFEELLIFLRVPKNLQPAKEFLLPLPEADKFDLAASFLETQSASENTGNPGEPGNPNAGEAAKQAGAIKQTLHTLARVKRPKSPNAKKKAEPPTNRGEFNRDVLALLNAYYAPPNELTIDKFKETAKKANRFRHHAFAVGGKNIQVYLYGPKGDPYEVALVFEYPNSERGSLSTKIELALEAFAVGNRAKYYFSGGVGEEQGGEAGSGAPAPGVF